MGEVVLVSQIFQTLGLNDLLKCKDILDSIINREYVKKDLEIRSKKPIDFVDYDSEFITKDSVEYARIEAEIESLKLKRCNNSPVTKWLTLTGQQYCWSSTSGHVTVKDPVDLKQYPTIHKIMLDINQKYGADLNSCLVSVYNNGSVCTTYHDDAEESLDPSQSIFVASFGAQRTVDFIYQGDNQRTKPLHSLSPSDGSLYIMKKGCQEFF